MNRDCLARPPGTRPETACSVPNSPLKVLSQMLTQRSMALHLHAKDGDFAEAEGDACWRLAWFIGGAWLWEESRVLNSNGR